MVINTEISTVRGLIPEESPFPSGKYSNFSTVVLLLVSDSMTVFIDKEKNNKKETQVEGIQFKSWSR